MNVLSLQRNVFFMSQNTFPCEKNALIDLVFINCTLLIMLNNYYFIVTGNEVPNNGNTSITK